MKKADFVWTIGYQGNVAQVNAGKKRAVASLASADLLAEGLLRPSFCAALWEERDTPGVLEAWRDSFVAKSGLKLSLDEIKRLLGVYVIPADTVKTREL